MPRSDGVRLPKISEKQFQAQIVQLAGLRGWLVYHTYDSREWLKNKRGG